MTDIKLRYLPQKLIEAGYNLECLGIEDIAWKSEDAIEVVKLLGMNGYPILGGDVYLYENGVITLTYDNWYVDGNERDNYIQKSMEKSIAFIKNYEKNRKYLFSIV